MSSKLHEKLYRGIKLESGNDIHTYYYKGTLFHKIVSGVMVLDFYILSDNAQYFY